MTPFKRDSESLRGDLNCDKSCITERLYIAIQSSGLPQLFSKVNSLGPVIDQETCLPCCFLYATFIF